MDYVHIMTTVASAVTVIYTIKTSLDKRFEGVDKRFEGVNKRFDKIEEILRNQDQRISKLEGEVEGMRGMLQTIVGFLLGHRTGTDGKNH